MRNVLSCLGAMSAVILAASPAYAQDVEDATGVYVSVNAGITSVKDTSLEYFDEGGTFGGTGAQDRAAFNVDLKSALAASGSIGYDFGLIRADIEVNYSRNKVKSLAIRSINGTPVTLTAADRVDVCDYLEVDTCGGSGNSFDVDGLKLRQLSALANIWVDVPTGSVVTPYVGGGLGVAGYEIDGEGKARFAWQLGGGVAFNLSPSVALTADYRYRQSKGATIEDEDFPDAGVRIGKVKSNIFTAGLRFKF